MNSDRHIKFDKAYNFRDAGGIQASDGLFLKNGILYRSDELSQLTPRDRKKFESLGIKLVIDLRGANERIKKIDRIPDSVTVLNIPVDHRNQDLKQKEFLMFLIKKSKDFDFKQYMREHYFGTAFDCAGKIGEIVTLLSDEKNLPALVHCTVGKDRTGVTIAILQLLAGVPREKVVEEYMATNKYIDIRVRQLIRMIRIMSLFRTKIDQIRPLLEVHPEYIENVIKEIYNRYGSVENYLVQCCGVEEANVIKLKNLVVEKKEAL